MNIIDENTDNLPKILIVEDDINHLEIVKKLLSSLDVDIYGVNSGHKALSLLLRHEFMLILLDVMMPGMDGLETAQLIRDSEKSKHIPIIFMTAFSKDEFHIKEGYKLGAIDYMFKPIDKNILLSKVDIFLQFFIKEKENLRRDREKEKEKEKGRIYKELVDQLEEKNKELLRSQLAALNIMEDANEARKSIEKSEALIKDQAKDLEQFAYTATHDLKTPINNIESYLTFLKKDKTITSEKSLTAIDWIDQSVLHCKRLIENLITVVKVKEEKSFDVFSIPIKSVLDKVYISLQSSITQSKCTIISDFDKCEFVEYSAPHLESLLLNLLGNAIKYRSPDRVLQIQISSDTDENFDSISVKDNGIGINVKRDKEKVFGLFKRAHKDTEGTGMGLYIVKETLKKFGGRIELESEVGVGSTFTVFFEKKAAILEN